MLDDEDELFIQYYLLYKLKNSKILWVAQVTDHYYKLKYSIRNFSSDIESYYIVSKKVPYSEIDVKFKQFTKFTKFTKFDYNIHYETILL
jgi:hypothetical protein